MTLLDDAPAQLAPSAVLPGPDDVRAALAGAGPTTTLVLVSLDPDRSDGQLLDRAAQALLRETRSRDLVARASETELAVVLTVDPADLDAVADRLLSVVERATGRTAAAGVCWAAGRTDPVTLARAGLAVAWACGGSRAVRHP